MKAEIMNGKAKNQVSETSSSEKPSQIHLARLVLIQEMAERVCVMAVVPREGICPYGRT